MRSLMGNCISCTKQKKQTKRSVTLAILGLDSAGKTTTTNALKGDMLDTAPTIGFNKEVVEFSNFSITLYDLGGGRKIRDIWKNYLSEIFGVIYIVDSSAHERMPEVKENLESLLSHEKVQQKPLLLLANKIDLPGHMDEVDIVHKLNINGLVNMHKCPCQVMMCSATKGTGRNMDKNIQDGMTWLCAFLNQQYDKLKVRVDGDVEDYNKVKEREAEERRERVRIAREEREKREEEERKKLGIEKEEDEESKEDFIDGDPFRRLDAEQLIKMEKKYQIDKAKEKAKQEKLKEIEALENSLSRIAHVNNNSDSRQNKNRSSNSMLDKQMKWNEVESSEHSRFNRDSLVAVHTSAKDDDDDNLRAPRSSRPIFSLDWMNGGLSNGYHNHQVNDDDDELTHVPCSARNVLSPLQGFSSIKSVDDTPMSSVRDKKGSNMLKNKVASNDLVSDNKYDDLYYSVSKIQVVSKDDDFDSDKIVQPSVHQDRLRNSRDIYMHDCDKSSVRSIEQKGKNKFNGRVISSEDKDGFDTLRQSQHFGEGEAAGQPENYKSPIYDYRISHSPQGLLNDEAKRSETPVKKLKKKKKHLRNNKLHPSDEEFEISDIQASPKRKPFPEVTSSSSPTMFDSEETDKYTNWGLSDSLDEMNVQSFQQSRPNFNSDDGIL